MLEQNTNESLPVRTSRHIKRMIIEGDMKPGHRLPSESELMQMFGVSRSTIREAVKSLKAENILEVRRGSGTYVSESTGLASDPLGLDFVNQDQLVADLLEARLIIEPQIASIAVERATEANIAELTAIVERMKGVMVNDASAADMDVKFHTSIAKCTQNDVLIRIVPIINESIRLGYGKTVHVEGSFERAKACHRSIYEAIVHRNKLEAKIFTERHIWETMNDIATIRERIK